MTDKPILFSAPMVRALLDGTKTQTRRIAKFITEDAPDKFHAKNSGGGVAGMSESEVAVFTANYAPWQIGDRLWVRETWYCDHIDCQRGPYLCPENMPLKQLVEEGWLHFRATDDQRLWEAGEPKWRTPLHLPRWGSRLTLTVTDVRVERLQDCSEADAIAEGLQHRMDWMPQYRGSDSLPWRSEFPRDAYHDLWNSINGAGAWEQNPWVVAVTFDVRKGNIDG